MEQLSNPLELHLSREVRHSRKAHCSHALISKSRRFRSPTLFSHSLGILWIVPFYFCPIIFVKR